MLSLCEVSYVGPFSHFMLSKRDLTRSPGLNENINAKDSQTNPTTHIYMHIPQVSQIVLMLLYIH